MNIFGAWPRQGHLDLTVRSFGYIKATLAKQITIDSRPMQFIHSNPNFEKLNLDFLEDYDNAKEELDPGFPTVFGLILRITLLVDSDHTHDLATRRSLIGLLAYVGSISVIFFSKLQGPIASSTYAAECLALRTAIEEVQNLRYTLRYLGYNVPSDGTYPIHFFGDILSVILMHKTKQLTYLKTCINFFPCY